MKKVQTIMPDKWVEWLKAEAKEKLGTPSAFMDLVKISVSEKYPQLSLNDLDALKQETCKRVLKRKKYDGSYANVCPKCNKGFPNRIKVDGKVKHVGGRKYCLECSPIGMKNTRNLLADKTRKWCPRCKKDLPRELFSNRHTEHGAIISASYCKECTKGFVRNREQDIKIKAVDYKGGKCQVCSYSRCIKALHFHHCDPSKKNFAISKSGHNGIKSLEDAKEELDKCVLVCSRCHAEIEEGIIPSPEIEQKHPSGHPDVDLQEIQMPSVSSQLLLPDSEVSYQALDHCR